MMASKRVTHASTIADRFDHAFSFYEAVNPPPDSHPKQGVQTGWYPTKNQGEPKAGAAAVIDTTFAPRERKIKPVKWVVLNIPIRCHGPVHKYVAKADSGNIDPCSFPLRIRRPYKKNHERNDCDPEPRPGIKSTVGRAAIGYAHAITFPRSRIYNFRNGRPRVLHNWEFKANRYNKK